MPSGSWETTECLRRGPICARGIFLPEKRLTPLRFCHRIMKWVNSPKKCIHPVGKATAQDMDRCRNMMETSQEGLNRCYRTRRYHLTRFHRLAELKLERLQRIPRGRRCRVICSNRTGWHDWIFCFLHMISPWAFRNDRGRRSLCLNLKKNARNCWKRSRN